MQCDVTALLVSENDGRDASKRSRRDAARGIPDSSKTTVSEGAGDSGHAGVQ